MRVRLNSSRLQTDLLTKLSSKTILLPNVQLVNQLASREARRTSRGGRKRSTISGTHGDVVVGVALRDQSARCQDDRVEALTALAIF
jgi:hypothetical protein